MSLSVALLVPLLVLMVVAVFVFAGCTPFDAADTPPQTTTTPPPPPATTTPPGPDPTPTPIPTPVPKAYADVITAEAGLRGYWRLGEVPGEPQAADSKPAVAMRRPGTYRQPGVTLGQPGVLRLGKDPTDNAAAFDGQGFVDIPNDALLNPPLSFSIEAWVRPAMTAAGTGVAVGSYEATPKHRGFVLEVIRSGAGGMTAQVRVGDDAQFTSLQADLGDGTAIDGWRHVVATYDGPTKVLKLYVSVSATPTVATAPAPVGYKAVDGTSSSPLRIGVGRKENTLPISGVQPAAFFIGRIDEVALYDLALDAATITSHFVSATTP